MNTFHSPSRVILTFSLLLTLLAGVAISKPGDIGGFGDPDPDPVKPDKPKPDKPDKPKRPKPDTPEPAPEKVVYPKDLQDAIDTFNAGIKTPKKDLAAAEESRDKRIAALRKIEIPKLQAQLKAEGIRLEKARQKKQAKLCAWFLKKSTEGPVDWSKVPSPRVKIAYDRLQTRLAALSKNEQIKIGAKARKLSYTVKIKAKPVLKEFDALIASAEKVKNRDQASLWLREKYNFSLSMGGDSASTKINEYLSIGPIYQSRTYPAKKIHNDLSIKPKHDTIRLNDTKLWAKSSVRHGVVNNLKMPEYSVQYFAVEVYATVEMGNYPLLLGSDDSICVFLNGKGIFRHDDGREVEADDDRIKVHLRAGKNLLVFKLHNGREAAGIYFKFGVASQATKPSLKGKPKDKPREKEKKR